MAYEEYLNKVRTVFENRPKPPHLVNQYVFFKRL